MYFYAQLNENKVCIGISQLSGEVIQDNLIEIPSADSGYLWKKFENGAWSTGSFEPQSTAPISEFEELKVKNTALQTDLTNTKLAMAELVEQQQADKLSSQLALAEVIESIMGGGATA
ncbi:hypothetical protein [Acetobacterium wieringae]|uniref:Uncharacterized protein n=1 Tax=Acetobacterium wieringae TaxID=52694 RepID=A0A1F2PDZ2_9FIRM|nr:hypothetical protein [Acetobacterium wieringae]OFV69245.1 hypothetical protein ACWI_32890 [Acetobacterium wieringae]